MPVPPRLPEFGRLVHYFYDNEAFGHIVSRYEYTDVSLEI